MNYGRFTPTGLPNMPFDMPLVAESFELSPMMRALSPWQEQMLLIDGLSNDQGLAGSGHSTGYAALSCVPNDPPNEVGRPGGETLDIFLSRTMGSTTLFPHVHLGVGRTFSPRIAAVSANAMRQPIPMFCRPADAYQQLFGAAFNAEGGRGGQQAELVMILFAVMQPVSDNALERRNSENSIRSSKPWTPRPSSPSTGDEGR